MQSRARKNSSVCSSKRSCSSSSVPEGNIFILEKESAATERRSSSSLPLSLLLRINRFAFFDLFTWRASDAAYENSSRRKKGLSISLSCLIFSSFSLSRSCLRLFRAFALLDCCSSRFCLTHTLWATFPFGPCLSYTTAIYAIYYTGNDDRKRRMLRWELGAT